MQGPLDALSVMADADRREAALGRPRILILRVERDAMRAGITEPRSGRTLMTPRRLGVRIGLRKGV